MRLSLFSPINCATIWASEPDERYAADSGVRYMTQQSVSVKAYFEEHTPPGYRRDILKRSTNALVRGDIKTMDELADASSEKLTRVRNMGAKCLELVFQLQERYITEMRETQRAGEARNQKEEQS